ncbi:MAG: MBL fold metallo-hydrolase [Pseudomonadota bacterium]
MQQLLEHDIVAIDVDYVRPGLATSHLIVADGRAAYVDTGTTHSVSRLLQALDTFDLEPDAVDFVFLTHIHLDHAGGAGALMRELPNARCVVHPRGTRHLADPTKLIAGSIAVYGEKRFRALYGDIDPIPSDRLISAEDGFRCSLASREFEFFHTEGHARHHHCIVDSASGGIFTGDSFGLSYRELDSPRGPFVFPTTTPVHFDPEAAHASVDAIAAKSPTKLFLTHYSEIAFDPRFVADMHTALDAFVRLTETHAGDADTETNLATALEDYLLERLAEHGSTLSVAEQRQVVAMDCELNAQGLVHWWQRYRA